MRTINLKIEDNEIQITELPIGKYAQLIKALKALPRHVAGFDKLNQEEILEKLPQIITDSLPEFLDILAIATPIDRKELETYGLQKIVKLVLAVIEVNDYQEVYNLIKKALAQKRAN